MTADVAGQDLTHRFLSAFAQIEKVLGHRYPHERFKGVGDAVRYAQKRGDRLANRHRDELAALIDLRNAISHGNYRDGLPIATPRRETVESVEKLASMFENPPRVEQFMTRQLLVAEAGDALAGYLRQMGARQISQVPVYRAGSFEGLLTTNAVALWVGSHMDGAGDIIAEAVLVEDVLASLEEHEIASFQKRSRPALEVCDLFAGAVPPAAVLITDNGRPGEKLLGLVTAQDVPRILGQLALPS